MSSTNCWCPAESEQATSSIQSGKARRQRSDKSGETFDPVLAASLAKNPMIFSKTLGNPQIQTFQRGMSNLTDNSASIVDIPSLEENDSTKLCGNAVDPSQPQVVSPTKSHESDASGKSYGMIEDHVGLAPPRLRLDHNNGRIPNTHKLDEYKEVDNPESGVLSSRNASIMMEKDSHRPTGVLQLPPRGSTFNAYPKSLIENSGVRLEYLDDLPRLVQRNRAFHQSSNKIFIKHNQGTRIFKLLRFNWFHVFLRRKTRWSLLILLTVWTTQILLFALIYVGYDNIQPSQACGLGAANSPIYFAGAFAFSLETCTTVGYGLPNGVNSFFEPDCSGLQVIIYFQMLFSMIFNAFLITFLYNRIGRSETRSTQVLYSNKALVSMVDDQIRFQIRLFDCDAKHPVVEAHVRLYCVMKHRPVPRPLRLLQPNDELGGTLFLSFPTVVSHCIDLYSLLHPPVATVVLKPKGLTLRQVDGATSYRDDVICPVCGESFGTYERWSNHVKFQQIVETQEEYQIEGTHRSLDITELDGMPGTEPIRDLEQLKNHFRQNVSEILCLVEGIDPMQSGTFHALQSYRFEDVVWDAHSQFSPCLSVEKKYLPNSSDNRIFCVDLDRYHDVVPDPEAAAAAVNAAMEEAAAKLRAEGLANSPAPGDSPVGRQRHRRIKTLSNRTSDSLFAPVSKTEGQHAETLAKGGIETV